MRPFLPICVYTIHTPTIRHPSESFPSLIKRPHSCVREIDGSLLAYYVCTHTYPIDVRQARIHLGGNDGGANAFGVGGCAHERRGRPADTFTVTRRARRDGILYCRIRNLSVSILSCMYIQQQNT